MQGFFGLCWKTRGFCPPFDHPCHLKSGVPPWDLIHAFLTLALEKLINLFLNEFCIKILHQALLFKYKFSFYKDFLTAKGDQSLN